MTRRKSQKEAERLHYSLRSTFFYRRRKNFKKLVSHVDRIDSSKYNWGTSDELGISPASLKYLKDSRIPLCKVFCHPDIIVTHPQLIAYYRSIAVLPQKGVQRLAFGVKFLEEGKGKELAEERAARLAKILNSYISSLVDGDPDFKVEDARAVGMMNYGTQLNGSWRNEIGNEGSRRVKELLLKYFLGLSLVSHVSSKKGPVSLPTVIPPLDEVQGFVATNGYSMMFGSEPDISIVNPKGVLEGAIEVKAGLDPAGALERYGAAKKSFDKALTENKSATTVYLASCITNGAKKAMADDRLVKKDFNLTDVFTDEKAREEFFKYIQWLMHL